MFNLKVQSMVLKYHPNQLLPNQAFFAFPDAADVITVGPADQDVQGDTQDC